MPARLHSLEVANARAEVKADAHYVTPHAGGDGALRDATGARKMETSDERLHRREESEQRQFLAVSLGL